MMKIKTVNAKEELLSFLKEYGLDVEQIHSASIVLDEAKTKEEFLILEENHIKEEREAFLEKLNFEWNSECKNSFEGLIVLKNGKWLERKSLQNIYGFKTAYTGYWELKTMPTIINFIDHHLINRGLLK